MGVGDNLFEGLPPPSAKLHASQSYQQQQEEEEAQLRPKTATANHQSSPLPAPPQPVLKSALKRPKPLQPNSDADGNSLL